MTTPSQEDLTPGSYVSMVGRWVRAHDLSLQEVLGVLPSGRRFRRLRESYYRRVLRACRSNLDVSQNVIVTFPQRLAVGSNVFINRGTFVTAHAHITIGDNALIGPYVIINSGDHLFGDRATPIRDQGHTARPIVIHSDVWIGAHAVILKGTVLGEGSVVAAGAVVRDDVPPYTVVAGVPARPIKARGGNLADALVTC